MSTVLITGANKGIGLAFARSFAVDGWKVHACCRHPEKAKELKATEGDISLHKVEVTDSLRIAGMAREMLDQPIDVLINNAGYYGARNPLGQLDYDDWAYTFNVNCMGPMRMVENFVEHVARSDRKLIVNISSKVGSIADNSSGGGYLYRSSKTALNMVTKSLSIDLADRGITVLALHPGHVQTDMGGDQALISTAKSVSGMRKIIENASEEENGRFFNYDGNEIPW